MLKPPNTYVEGYEKACLYDQAAADNYIKHTWIGDPELDPVMAELSSMPPAELHRFIRAGIEQEDEVLRLAPQALRDVFDNLQDPPWLDYEAFKPGIRTFSTNVDLMLIAFVTGVLVEGFSTLIAKSFRITGRVQATTRRLQQNNRHMMEIFFPGGMYRENDGWKLSTRIRFIHARIRALLAESDDWDHEAWGVPVSTAHLGFAISVFSKRLIDYSKRVGARFDNDEEASILSIWRYAGYLMGIPETILYTDGQEAEEVRKVAYMCEPVADSDSIGVANALIQAIPSVAGITETAEKEKLVGLAYRLSRALIGDQLSEQFQYPSKGFHLTPTLFSFRTKQRIQRLLNKGTIRTNNFTQLLQISVFDDHGLSYKMPNHVYTSKSIEW